MRLFSQYICSIGQPTVAIIASGRDDRGNRWLGGITVAIRLCGGLPATL